MSPLTSVMTPVTDEPCGTPDPEQPDSKATATATTAMNVRSTDRCFIVLTVDNFFEFAAAQDTLETTLDDAILVYHEDPRF